MEAETDRLAEAYAAGARVLGQQLLEPSLHAADYVATDRRERALRPPPSTASPGCSRRAGAAGEEQTRQELRASALRAKLKAQAAPQEPPSTGDAGLDQPAAEGTGLDEAKAGRSGTGRARSVDVGTERAATGSACCWAAPWLCCSGPASWRSTRSWPPRRPRGAR